MSKFGEEGIKDKEFVRSYFEKKLGYKRPVPYHELIRKPQPDDVDKHFKKKINKEDNKYYDEDF